MAVNRYDNPAQAQFINTYVPIPFEQLYTLGKQANERVDKALADYRTAANTWAEFQSQSMKDMQTWDAETRGKVLPIIDQAAKNPEAIKSMEWQMALQSAINNVDRAKLSALKQSAANFEAYNKAKQALIASGKYNPLWHDRNFTNWDTTTQGLYKDISPIAYQSINDLVDPYVNDLKPSDMGSDGGYLYHGVSADRTRAQVDSHLSEILATPQAQMHVRTMIAAGINPEQARDTFVQQVYTAAREKAWRDRAGVDQFALLNARLSAERNQPQDTSQSRVMELDASLAQKRTDLLSKELRKAQINGVISNNPTEEDIRNLYSNIYKEALGSNNPSKVRELINSQSIPFSEGEFKIMLDPNFPDSRDADIYKKGEPEGKNKRITLTDFTHVVPMSDAGIPVAEISKEFLLNNEKSILDSFKSWGLDGSITKRREKLNDLVNSYGSIINDLVSNIQVGYMKPNGRLQDYGIINDNGLVQMPLVPGKVLVSESEIDAILENNKGKYGNLSTGDIKKILFEKGINGKHKIGNKLEDKPYTSGNQMEENYYELNIGYPALSDPAQIKAFEDAYAAKVFGGGSSFKAEPSHAAISFDSRRTNSNM